MFSNTWFQLQQEGYLIRSALGSGLTDLRNADLETRGRFYSAFFELSIGIERAMKLALILEHMASHDLAAPGSKTVRDYGHNLINLYNRIERIAIQKNLPISFSTATFGNQILNFLNNFATTTRYSNLDSLASGTSGTDPLNDWNNILNSIFQKDVSQRTKNRINKRSNNVKGILGSVAYVLAHDLGRKPLSVLDIFSAPAFIDQANRYAVWHVIQLLAPIKEVIVSLTEEAQALEMSLNLSANYIPYLNEFLTFIFLDKSWVLRKKSWMDSR